MFISSNPPLIPGICTVAPTSTMVRLRLQRAATKSSCPKKRGTKEVQPGTKQGQPGTKQGQPGTKQGQPGTKQGQPGTKKDKGIIGQTPDFFWNPSLIDLGWVCWPAGPRPSWHWPPSCQPPRHTCCPPASWGSPPRSLSPTRGHFQSTLRQGIVGNSRPPAPIASYLAIFPQKCISFCSGFWLGFFSFLDIRNPDIIQLWQLAFFPFNVGICCCLGEGGTSRKQWPLNLLSSSVWKCLCSHILRWTNVKKCILGKKAKYFWRLKTIF